MDLASSPKAEEIFLLISSSTAQMLKVQDRMSLLNGQGNLAFRNSRQWTSWLLSRLIALILTQRGAIYTPLM
ncbi:hypothetical protein L195_g043481 [Trifolium pratense]|uniref:Uncharacterized protein n=1 Tax=Trifolium pratense TaxID=57577 RepID=A0A2K3M9F6_TRIPR|nr:hypothetical protein L195_g043481 [Trifolium pratense]